MKGPSCVNCIHNRNGKCNRPKTLADGTIQLRLATYHDDERNERSPTWKRVKRMGGDICGKAGKWWTAA